MIADTTGKNRSGLKKVFIVAFSLGAPLGICFLVLLYFFHINLPCPVGAQAHENRRVRSTHQDRVTRGQINPPYFRDKANVQNPLIFSKLLQWILNAKTMKVVSRSVYDPIKDHLKVELFKAQLPGLGSWNIQGSLTKVTSGNPDLNLRIEGEKIPLGEMKEFMESSGLEWLKAIQLEGHAEANLNLTGNMTSPILRGILSAEGKRLSIEGKDLRSFALRVPVECKMDETFIREAIIKGKSVSLDLSKDKGITYRLDNVELSIPYAEHKGSRILSRGLLLKADKAVVYRKGMEYYTEKGISLRGELSGDLERGRLSVKDFSLNMASLKGVSGEISVELGSRMTVEATLEHQGLDLEKVGPKVLRFFPAGQDLSIKGKTNIRAHLHATIPKGGSIHLTGKAEVGLTEGGFSSPEGSMVGEGIDLKVSSGFGLSLPLEKAEFTLDAEATDFELLLERFYGDFKDKRLGLSVEGEYLNNTGSLQVSRANLSLTDIGTLLLSGNVSNLTQTPHFDGEVHLVKLSNREGYDFFIRETFQESFPFLSGLAMDGITTAVLSAKGSGEGFHAHGEIQVQEMNVLSKELGIAATGMNISLPVDISYPEAPSLPKKIESFGSLRFQNLSWRALEIQHLEVFPVLWQNSLVFREDIALPVFGGRVLLKDLSYKDILSPRRNLRLSIDVDAVDLTEVSIGLGLPKFSGSLTATIPKVSFTGRSLLTEGEVALELFGGETRVKEISIHNIFSPVASLKSTIELKEIDLGRLTHTFELGHMSGILQGYFKDLVVTQGQPESLDAQIETVKRRGVSQRISVEALEKISILGTGASASILSRGIYRLFKEYRYAKMGFKCSLKNDKFVLIGIEVEGNKGYLVKGGLLPPKVNVISYTQNISFREMVKRLKRIQEAGKAEVKKEE